MAASALANEGKDLHSSTAALYVTHGHHPQARATCPQHIIHQTNHTHEARSSHTLPTASEFTSSQVSACCCCFQTIMAHSPVPPPSTCNKCILHPLPLHRLPAEITVGTDAARPRPPTHPLTTLSRLLACGRSCTNIALSCHPHRHPSAGRCQCVMTQRGSQLPPPHATLQSCPTSARLTPPRHAHSADFA